MFDRDKLVKSLKNVRILKGLNEEQLLKFAEFCEVKSFKKGEKIIQEGESTSELYILISGSCDIEVEISEYEKYFVITSIKEHEIFGEIGFIDGAPRLATVICTMDSEVATMSTSNFEKLIKEDPLILVIVLKNIALVFTQKIRATHNRFRDIYWKGMTAV